MVEQRLQEEKQKLAAIRAKVDESLPLLDRTKKQGHKLASAASRVKQLEATEATLVAKQREVAVEVRNNHKELEAARDKLKQEEGLLAALQTTGGQPRPSQTALGGNAALPAGHG